MLMEIGGKRYPLTNIEDLTLKQSMLLQREMNAHPEMTSIRSLRELREVLADYAELIPEAQEAHPESVFLLAVTVWATRIAAGEDLSLLDAVDVPISQIHWIVEPGDKKPVGKAKGGASRAAAPNRKR